MIATYSVISCLGPDNKRQVIVCVGSGRDIPRRIGQDTYAFYADALEAAKKLEGELDDRVPAYTSAFCEKTQTWNYGHVDVLEGKNDLKDCSHQLRGDDLDEVKAACEEHVAWRNSDACPDFEENGPANIKMEHKKR